MIIYNQDLMQAQEGFKMNKEYVYILGYSNDFNHEVIDVYEDEEMALNDLKHFRIHCPKSRSPSAYYILEKELVLANDDDDDEVDFY